jgi:pyruvate/2-oxoglutarate dehydrogenase complex dihydrolipoamide acyltransferase (E2) component
MLGVEEVCMSQESTITARTGLAFAAAVAALTLAAGVTAGSLLGWIGPGRGGTPADAAPPEAAPAEAAPPAGAATAKPAVPVFRDEETATARRQRRHHGRHEGRREHRERDHDD